MKYRSEGVMYRLSKVGLILAALMVACDDESGPDTMPEPQVFNFRYLSVDVYASQQPKGITEITFHADDLVDYAYVLWQGGTRRINCASNTFIDVDDELITQDNNSVTFVTDEDVVFDVVDKNGNIARFTPSITGATSVLIHGTGVVLSGDDLTTYVSDITREVNKMPNSVYEIN